MPQRPSPRLCGNGLPDCQGGGCTVGGCRSPVLGLGNQTGRAVSNLLLDGVHSNEQGHQLNAEHLLAELERFRVQAAIANEQGVRPLSGTLRGRKVGFPLPSHPRGVSPTFEPVPLSRLHAVIVSQRNGTRNPNCRPSVLF